MRISGSSGEPPRNSGSPHLFTPFGTGTLMEDTASLVAGNFNLLLAADQDVADAAVSHFLAHALANHARAAVVSIDNPRLRLHAFSDYGFDFANALEDDRLVYLYYRPTLSRALGLAADYGQMVQELRRLAGPVERIAFLTPEILFNLESEQLATDSISRFAASAPKLSATALGAFIAGDTPNHVRLRHIGSQLLPGAYTLMPKPGSRTRYTLQPLKGHHRADAVHLSLEKGRGYVAERGFNAQTA